MPHQSSRPYERALAAFTTGMARRRNVVAVLVSGSYVHGRMDANSDLDVFVVTERSATRERGNTWIEGVEIEYFVNPVEQIRSYFAEERGAKAPCTAHMFVHGRVLFRRGDVIDELRREAQAVLRCASPSMKKVERELARYHLDDLAKDLDDVHRRRDGFAFETVARDVLSACLNVFYRIRRFPPGKSKRLAAYLSEHDRTFANRFTAATMVRGRKARFTALCELVRHTEMLVGGRRPREWRLRSRCTTAPVGRRRTP